MKIRNIISILSGLLLSVGQTACEDEKELIIIDGNLPIKTSSLYMVGDATPNGWNIDSPTPLTAAEEDPLVFTWEGPLNVGEMKLCLATGSWDNPFIRPQTAGEQINKSGITDVPFKMHAGDPDDKWKVSEAGIYNLHFDLRNWKMSVTYVREQDAPVKDPIDAETVYLVGDFNGWNIDSPAKLEKKSDYVFVYEGALISGEIKACLTTGSWDVAFIRPETNGTKIDRNGIEQADFVFVANPDNKWKVEESGLYRLTFDLRTWTLKSEYTGDFKPSAKLYMIGEATDGGWSWDAATVIESQTGNDKLFIWEGELGRGSLKASETKDFNAPFYRPESPDCEISENGVTNGKMVFTTSPDDQWKVVKAGKYRLTFNIAEMTFEAKYIGEDTSVKPLYILGDATPGGWSQDEAAQMTPVEGKEGEYTWTGILKKGQMKAFSDKDPNWGQSFYRPSKANVEISKSGVAESDMVFTNSPDDQWKIVDEGKYQLTLNTKALTISVKFLD